MALALLSLPSCQTPKQTQQPVVEQPKQEIAKTEQVIEELPGLGGSVQFSSESYYRPEDVSVAIMLFHTYWTEVFGDPDHVVFDATQNLIIIWKPEVWEIEGKGYTLKGKPAWEEREGKFFTKIRGLTQNKNTIILTAEKNRLSTTPLMHELTHIALWHTQPKSKGDADHEGDEHPGWTVKHSGFVDFMNFILVLLEEAE